MPQTSISPASGCRRPITHSSVVVLPDPFGPSSPKISPSSISKLTPCAACTSSYRLCRSRTMTFGIAVLQDTTRRVASAPFRGQMSRRCMLGTAGVLVDMLRPRGGSGDTGALISSAAIQQGALYATGFHGIHGRALVECDGVGAGRRRDGRSTRRSGRPRRRPRAARARRSSRRRSTRIAR